MTTDLQTLIDDLRKWIAGRLASDLHIGEAGRLLADAEEEVERRARFVDDLKGRVDELGAESTSASDAGEAFFKRPRPVGLDGRAARPRPKRLSDDLISRGVAIAYETANPTFYRSVIDRLRPGEKVRNVTRNHGWYEYTRDEFERELPGIASSASYRTGTTTAPGKARYVTGRPPAAIERLLAPDYEGDRRADVRGSRKAGQPHPPRRGAGSTSVARAG